MANTVIKYVEEYGDYTFLEKPMNDVDSLILCQLAYLKYDGLIPLLFENRASISMRQLAAKKGYEKLFDDEFYGKDNKILFEAMLKSKRFGKMKMNCYINIIEKEWETQFSAITFLLEDGTIYLAYRGTDEMIVGWKEDFNMAYLSPVPGQEYSKKYMNMVTGRLRNSFYVGGHSKGGNLAVYAAMNCAEDVQKRIIKIYSMDGPGFRPEVLERCGYDKIADRIVKILPQSSVVGMIFESDTRYAVVRSKTFGLLQHNPYTWLVEGDEFIYMHDVRERRKQMGNTLNQWILSLNEDQLRTFVDTLFQVVSASKAENLSDLTADWRLNMNRVISAIKELDENTTKMLKEVIKTLFELGLGKGMAKKPKVREKKPTIGSRQKS